jgi:hypothetical protein
MKEAIVLLVLTLCLSGCVARHMNEGLNKLLGQNVQVAIDHVGYPDTQRTMLGHTIYVWGRSQSGVMPIFNSGTTTGMIGDAPVSTTTTSTDFVPVNYNCTIQLAVDSDQIIKSMQWAGNAGGCSPYAKALVR